MGGGTSGGVTSTGHLGAMLSLLYPRLLCLLKAVALGDMLGTFLGGGTDQCLSLVGDKDHKEAFTFSRHDRHGRSSCDQLPCLGGYL